jgi:hypothetical protein
MQVHTETSRDTRLLRGLESPNTFSRVSVITSCPEGDGISHSVVDSTTWFRTQAGALPFWSDSIKLMLLDALTVMRILLPPGSPASVRDEAPVSSNTCLGSSFHWNSGCFSTRSYTINAPAIMSAMQNQNAIFMSVSL